ncbi:MAG: DUF2723 domain-containing protein [Bergeyella sp.]|nr:DUF2723 domain-containing protein [Bergeyella sp.]
MKNWDFKKWNTVVGGLIFVISLSVYLSTIEPNFSFWDCGEYISSAVNLGVTHAPGAAFFQIVGAVVSMFAFGNTHKYSLVINAMSATFSAFTVLLLFWTVTHFLKTIIQKGNKRVGTREEIVILFSGSIGALCFAFSDTFWFSAVEGEVYAMASMFIALILWFIIKWENEYDQPYNERWIILIFFTVGLSLGVHMMCMLVLPAVCLIYYAKKYTFSWKSFFYANLIALFVLALVFKYIFPLIMSLFGKMEIFAVNGLGLPFNSGTSFAFIILVSAFYYLITKARASGNKLYQTVVLSLTFMIIGFSCWLVIPIRANANPSINLNDPDSAIGMLDYYNREQYGDWPTTYGQNYTAHLDANGIEKTEDGNYKTKKDDGLLRFGDIYEKDEDLKKYVKVGERFNYVYSKEHVSFFPKMYNENRGVMANYISMYGAPDFTFNYGNPSLENNPAAYEAYEKLREKYENKTITVDDYLEAKRYDLIKVKRPTFFQNLDYFITFQNGYYFVRYLLWNFVGRQNDLEGNQENTKGNWISGIPFIDNFLYGDQSKLSDRYTNETTVKFFFLPFILGILGFIFQAKRDFGRFYATLSLFVVTSVGIIFYTSVKPYEPRERDYAMVGSFYAFAIWIGLGAGAILSFMNAKFKNKKATFTGGILLLGVPMLMGFQNYTPHDRSRRYAAYDYSYSVLEPLKKNDILFVYGDNDTYPVWAIQETERFRDDVKVVNFTLASTPWYIDQVKRRIFNSMPVPSSLDYKCYRNGTNDQIYLFDKQSWKGLFENLGQYGISPEDLSGFEKYLTQDSMSVKEAIDFIQLKSDQKDLVLKILYGEDRYEKFNFLPVRNFILPVNKQNAVSAKIIKSGDLPEVVDAVPIRYKKQTMYKNNLLLLDILANFDWKRPINFSSGGVYDDENIFYLNDYLQLDGFSYRLVPIKTLEKESKDMGRVDKDDLYKTVKHFRWGNFKDLGVHYDETATLNILSYRSAASRAAEALFEGGERQKAIEILNLASREIPIKKYQDTRSVSALVYAYILVGEEKKGLELSRELRRDILKEYAYYTQLSPVEKRYAGRQFRLKPFEYSLVVSAVSDAYKKRGEKGKGYQYILESMMPIDEKYKEFTRYLERIGKEKSQKESDKISEIMPFYQYLFEVVRPYDSTFAQDRIQQISSEIIRLTQ